MYMHAKNQYRNGAIIVLITILFIPTTKKKEDILLPVQKTLLLRTV